jgi:hypothetical protein
LPINRACLIALVLTTVACGSGSPSVTSATPSFASVNGVWTGNATFVGVDGGDCLGADIQAAGRVVAPVTITVQQNGSQATATWGSPNNSGTFSYSGTVSANTVNLTLESCSSCSPVRATCTNGAVREVRLLSGTFMATTDGRSMSGTDVKVYNVLVGDGASVMSGTQTFTLTKQ